MKLRWLMTLEEVMTMAVLTGEILTEEELFKRLRELVNAGLVMMIQRKSDGRWYVWLTPPAVIIDQYWVRKGYIPQKLIEIVANLAMEPNEENAKVVRKWFKHALGYVPTKVNEAIRLLLDGDKWGIAWLAEDWKRLEEGNQENNKKTEIMVVMDEVGQLQKYEIEAVVDVSGEKLEIISMRIKM